MSSTGKKSAEAWPPDQVALYGAIGRRIRELRAERGLTQEKLAKLIHLTRTSLVNIEQGRQRLLLHTLVRIAEVLAIRPSELLENSNNKTQS